MGRAGQHTWGGACHVLVLVGGCMLKAVNTPCHPCPKPHHPVPHPTPPSHPPPPPHLLLCKCPVCPCSAPTLTLTPTAPPCRPQKLQHLLESASKQALPTEKLLRVSLLRSAYQRPTEEPISTIKEEQQPQ
jgi:hypothetical protein